MSIQSSQVGGNELRLILTDPQASAVLVRKAEDLGRRLAQQQLKASQIRAIFDEVRQIEALWLREDKAGEALHKLHLLKPKMAIRKARIKEGVPALVDELTQAVDIAVESSDCSEVKWRFHRFVEYFEAVLAYHKAFGGRD